MVGYLIARFLSYLERYLSGNRACRKVGFTLSGHEFLKIFSFLLIRTVVITLVLVLRHSIEKHSMR